MRIVSAIVTLCLMYAPQISIAGEAPPTQPATTQPATALPATTLPAPARAQAIPGVGDFAQISPVLFRGEQPTAAGFRELRKLGVRTIVNLRSFHGDHQLLSHTGLGYVRIDAKAWHPEDEDIVAFLKIVENPANQPVFVHCMQGADRTGMMVAAYRIVEQQWTPADAIAEMNNFGFHPIWTQIPPTLQGLQITGIRDRLIQATELPIREMN